MKYGKLSHGVVDVDQKKYITINAAADTERPTTPVNGDIRYNHDREAKDLGDNSGKGQYEIYKNGDWYTLLTEMDFEHSEDARNKETPSDNAVFKMITDALKDSFITAIGNLSLVQDGVNLFGFKQGWRDNDEFPGEYTNFGSGSRTQTDLEVDPSTGEQTLPGYLSEVQWSGPAARVNSGRGVEVHTGDVSGNNLTSAFKAFVGNNRIYSVNVDDTGAGYDHDNPPQLLLDTGGGRGAVLQPHITNGIIHRIDVIESGSGYRPQHTRIVMIGGNPRTDVEADIIYDQNNGIERIVVTYGGSEYDKVPEAIVADGGHGAIIEPVMSNPTGGLGQIIAVKVSHPGYNYTVTPQVVIKSDKTPTRHAAMTCVIGEKQILSIKLMKPVVSDFTENDEIDLIIEGGNPITPAGAKLIIKNGVGSEVRITNTGRGYDSVPKVRLPNNFPDPTTDVAVYRDQCPDQFLDFKFNIFEACGVPQDKKHLYDISLLNNIVGSVPLLNPYSGATVSMMLKFTPQWSPFGKYNHQNYGLYSANISLYGQRHYYSSSVHCAWRAEVTKSRNET